MRLISSILLIFFDLPTEATVVCSFGTMLVLLAFVKKFLFVIK